VAVTPLQCPFVMNWRSEKFLSRRIQLPRHVGSIPLRWWGQFSGATTGHAQPRGSLFRPPQNTEGKGTGPIANGPVAFWKVLSPVRPRPGMLADRCAGVRCSPVLVASVASTFRRRNGCLLLDLHCSTRARRHACAHTESPQPHEFRSVAHQALGGAGPVRDCSAAGVWESGHQQR
jgi:hypothetical protein